MIIMIFVLYLCIVLFLDIYTVNKTHHAFDYAKQNPFLTALLCSQVAVASALPAVFTLSRVDGTNGFKINGETADDRLGSSVSFAGDINGDGYDDLIIGAYQTNPNGKVDAGSSYVIFGKKLTWSTPFELTILNGINGFKINGEVSGDCSGFSVSSAGDVNGDGITDLIISAHRASPNEKDHAGSSYVIFGKNSTWVTPFELSTLNGANGFKINGEASYDYSGISVSSAGDINGDGLDDLIIGAYDADPNEKGYAGSSYVIFGKNSTWVTPFELSTLNGANGFKINGEALYDHSGVSVSYSGDINGDGLDDLIIGAYRASPNSANPNGKVYAGTSYVVFGKNGTWTTPFELSILNGTNGFKINGETSGDYSGISVSSAGDVNGDGLDDLIIGAYGAKDLAGSSYVIFGKNSTWVTPFELSTLNGANGFKINGESVNDFSGYSVSSAGDVNGDGITDLIIGAYRTNPNGKVDAGSSYVIFGKNGTWSTPFELSILNGTNGFKINGETSGDYSGISVSSAGDVNGDGITDLIIGAFVADPETSRSTAGSSYVLFVNKLTFDPGDNADVLLLVLMYLVGTVVLAISAYYVYRHYSYHDCCKSKTPKPAVDIAMKDKEDVVYHDFPVFTTTKEIEMGEVEVDKNPISTTTDMQLSAPSIVDYSSDPPVSANFTFFQPNKLNEQKVTSPKFNWEKTDFDSEFVEQARNLKLEQHCMCPVLARPMYDAVYIKAQGDNKLFAISDEAARDWLIVKRQITCPVRDLPVEMVFVAADLCEMIQGAIKSQLNERMQKPPEYSVVMY